MFERNRIAETLRSAREKQGLSLEQAAASAGIPLQYVRLLEGESNVRVGVSDELYLIPFFRKYAQFVGINAEEMLPEFLGAVQQISGEGSPPLRLAYRPRWAFLWKPAAVLFAIAVAVLLMLRQGPEHTAMLEEHASVQPNEDGVAPLSSPSETTTPAADVVAASANVATPAGPGVVETIPTAAGGIPGSTSPRDPIPTVTPGVEPTGTRELSIAAIEETWLSLAVDDQSSKQYVLRAGETRAWTALRSFTLTVGNAGGISLSLDGRELPAIGRTGQVVRNLRLLDGAATRSEQ